ncbi:MAG: carbon-nitrogen hydrolase family protein [Bradymonadales bacterium]|nr:carbon-nitrogen hydrolase family protein [Bradymonadales bacterium]
MPEPGLWAVAQMTGSSQVEGNLEQAAVLVERAAGAGCELVALPENTTYMGHPRDRQTVAEPLDGRCGLFFGELASRHRIAILVGSLVERSPLGERPYNTAVLFGPNGAVAAVYRKMHLFDAQPPGDRGYRESQWTLPGEATPVVAEVHGVKVGLTICFDLRFPWLYRALADRGAQVLFVPAAFTEPTGRDHWSVLLRARAIETGCYVLAPAQYGQHDTGRRTYGRSMVVDPWGVVLATVADGGDLAMARLDLTRVEQVRRQIPLPSRQKG